MASKRIKEFVVILLTLSILSGCVNRGDDDIKATLPSPVTPTTPTVTTDSAKPTPSQSVELNPNMNKFDASISADGSHLLYSRKERKGSLSQVPCEISLLDLESGQEISVSNPNQADICHTFGWLENNIYVQWNEFHSSGLTNFTIFDGKSGKILESGWLYQYLEESQTRIVLLHPPKKDGEPYSLGADIRIGVLTPDGAFHLLFEQNVYEVQFLDIQLSRSLGAMTIWSHQLPTNSSQLWIAPIDMEQWSAGEWQALDIKPASEGGTISYDENGIVLSDGRRFDLPWLG